MDTSPTLSLILLVICLLFSAFFASSETAFISLQRLRIRHLVNQGVKGARQLEELMNNPGRLLATVLVGNNLANTAAAALGTTIAALYLRGDQAVIAATIVVTILLLVFGEITPKSLAAQHAERLAFLYLRPIHFFNFIFRPVVLVLEYLSLLASRLSGREPGEPPPLSEEEILTVISTGREEGVLESGEAQMMERVLEFTDTRVREVMVPRTEIHAVPAVASLQEIIAQFDKSRHSRLLVYDGDLDHIIGFVHALEALLQLAQGDHAVTARELVRPIHFVPEGSRVPELMQQLRMARTDIAIVIDEYGGTAGMVTVADLMEEIVGEFYDDLRRQRTFIRSRDELTAVVDARIDLEQFNEEFHTNLVAEDAQTLGGLLLELLGSIPEQPGVAIEHAGLRFEVLSLQGNRLGWVRVTRLPSKKRAAKKQKKQ